MNVEEQSILHHQLLLQNLHVIHLGTSDIRFNAMNCVYDDHYSQALGPIVRSQGHFFDATVRQVIDTLVIPRGDTFTIGDYGCHNGFSSQEIFGYMIDSLKQRYGEQLPVHIIYEDQANNDFNALIQTVCSNGKMSVNHSKVYMSMCPTSFYDQCVPDNTFHILLCFWSAHYLYSSVSYEDSLFTCPDATCDEIDAVATQACDEWQLFLLNRAKEIKPGGYMMLIVPAEDTERRYGQSRVHLQNLWAAMTTVWRLFRDLCVITKCEYEATNYSGYYRSEEELRAPFCDEASPVVKAGLRIKSLEISHHEPYSMKRCIQVNNKQKAMTCFFDDQYSRVLGPMIPSQVHHFDDTVRQVIDTLVIPSGDTFTIGDYGCYNGFSSLEIFGHIIGGLKQRYGEDMPVHIIYEDQNSNDYNALIQTVCSNGKVCINHPKVYMSMCPTSFYDQCVPDNTFHLLLCFWSAHYLSSSVLYEDSLFTFPDGTRDEINTVATQAFDEWQQFLLIRANEIKSGGYMMLIVPAEDRGRKYGQSRVHLQNMWAAMTSVWRLFRDTDLITECEYKATNYSGYYRSEEELRAPFCDEASPVVKAGLRIKSLEISHRVPYSMKQMTKTKKENGGKEDLDTSVGRFLWTIRSWTEHIFLQALSSRSRESRRDVVNTFYDRLLEHLKQQDMSNCGWNNIIAYIVITKK